MIWFAFAFASAIMTAIGAIIEKKTLIKEHAMEFSSVFSIFTLILSIPFFFLIDYSRLTLFPVLILAGVALLDSIAFLLIAKAIRHMEISSASPLLVLSPGITSILAFLFLGETLTTIQISGIVLLIGGSYVLETKSHHNLLEPLKIFRKSKYIHYLLLALLFYGISSIAARYLFLQEVQLEVVIGFLHLFIAIYLFIMLHIFHDGVKGIKHGMKKSGFWIFLMAFFTVASRYALFWAIKLAFVGLVVAIKRTSALFATFIGGEIFHEKNLLRKIIATLIMVIGAVFIVI